MTKNTMDRYFHGRRLLIATSHGKEQVLKPLLEEALGVVVAVPERFDSDEFGTFSGETEPKGSLLDTARSKCEKVHATTGADLVLASEGSFGAHPQMGFLPADAELLLLKDYRFDYEVRANILSTQTNFAANEYRTWDELLFFAVQAGFPAHGLIMRESSEHYSEIHRGIRTWDDLKTSFSYFRSKRNRVWVETDMRARYNPTRMKAIAMAGEQLVAAIRNQCPVCDWPAFSVRETLRGLPCSNCEEPTRSPKAHIYVCPHCGHSETKPARAEKPKEDPMFCDNCTA